MRDTRDTSSAMLPSPWSRPSLVMPVSCSRSASSLSNTSKCCWILSVKGKGVLRGWTKTDLEETRIHDVPHG